MDKQWMDVPRNTNVYLQGVRRFLDQAFSNSAVGNKILCPCKNCVNLFWRGEREVREHLICDGFLEGYKSWEFHGERNPSFVNCDLDNEAEDGESCEDDDISDLLRDLAYGLDDRGDFEDEGGCEEANEDLEALEKLVNDSGQELYPGCQKYSKLRFIVRLLHTKLLGGWSDKSFDLLLDLLNDVFPEGSVLPKNYNEAKKTVKCLGLGYVSIHACENDCMLFWKENANSNVCPKCETSRWKSEKMNVSRKRVHKVPKKVLRYFPVKRRFQRLFVSSRTATLMRWHDEERTKDGLLRHPADSLLWKDFDQKNPGFASDSRNIRLALSTDGINPFRSLNVSYSIWPVILIPYNFPPWMCMKQPNFILSMIIPGRHAPGSDMDVYFEPLVDDMLDMFVHGVRTFDASKGEYFQLRAAILCTISDYPGLGYVAGCVTSGEGACIECHSFTCSLRLKNGGKSCYMGHRRFLDQNHQFRFDADSFDSVTETRTAPIPLSGDEILVQTEGMQPNFGKGKKPKKRKRKEGEPIIIWKRRSIWFRLPYWKDLLLRHNLDVMHIEKNVCDNIINTLLGIDGKSKDNLNSRLDLQALDIRSDLHPIEVEDRFYLPPAPYSMTPNEKKLFCEVLKSVKFPDGYASDIRHNVHVNEKKIIGLKSHDNHVLIQHLLPLAVRRILPTKVSAALIRVSNFFKKIYSPVIRPSDMQKLGAEIAETLSLLETIFLPSFFDVMVHLMVHLPAQAMIAGPVHFRNMYPIERFLMRCKGYVRTRSHPDGSIAESYLFTIFTSRHINYLSSTGLRSNREINRVHHETFHEWFREHVRSAIGKMNRGKLRMLHTSGSKSHARVGYDMTVEQGRPARRDEVWIATHLHKNGVPTIQAASTVRELKAAAENHPELMERTIQEGDLFASVCGEKEPRGRVRCLGLGPTPQDVGTPGTQSKMPTRLQIEIACHQQTKKDFASLNNRVDNMQQEMDQMKKMIQASEGMQNVELSSQHGSTSRHMSPPCEEHELAHGSHDSDIEADCARLQAVLFNDNENIVHRRVIQRGTSVRVSATPRNHTSSCNEDESLVGKDVILYAVTRNDIPVAKATIVSTDPSATVGGQALGVQYYEVVVNVVLKRDTVLPRPYDGIETMADAYMLSIAWPNNKIRASKSPCISQCGGGGSVRT